MILTDRVTRSFSVLKEKLMHALIFTRMNVLAECMRLSVTLTVGVMMVHLPNLSLQNKALRQC